jgi:hypothetical protein
MGEDVGQRPLGLLPGLYRALIVPDRSFAREDQFTVSRFLLFLQLCILVFAGSMLAETFHQNETMQILSSTETTRRIEKMMANVPKEQRDAAIQRALGTQNADRLSPTTVIGLIVGAALWPLFVLEIWFLSIILMQFLGGEEKPVGDRKHRRSQYLALYCIAPVAFQALVRGLVYAAKDSSAVGSVLTMEEYMDAVEVSFSLVALLGVGRLPGFVEYLVHNLTNPFCLWTLAVATFGAKSVFAVRIGRSFLMVSVVFVVIGLQNQLFAKTVGFFGG